MARSKRKNSKEIREELNKKLKKMLNDEEIRHIYYGFAVIGYNLVDHDPEINELFDLGYEEDSRKVQSLINEKMIKESEEFQDEIKYALKKIWA